MPLATLVVVTVIVTELPSLTDEELTDIEYVLAEVSLIVIVLVVATVVVLPESVYNLIVNDSAPSLKLTSELNVLVIVAVLLFIVTLPTKVLSLKSLALIVPVTASVPQ